MKKLPTTKQVLSAMAAEGWELDIDEPADEALVEKVFDALLHDHFRDRLAEAIVGGGPIAEARECADRILGALQAIS